MSMLRVMPRFDDPNSEGISASGYAADAINAGRAVRRTIIPWIDNTRVAVLGRSMGGAVAFQALVIRPGVFDTAITYASMSSDAEDNLNMWQRGEGQASRTIISLYGAPEDNPSQWARMSSRTYFSRITEPVLMMHGTQHESCNIAWSRATRDALEAAGKDVPLVECRGAGQYMYRPWQDSIRQVSRFLKQNLGS